jgi:CheY-like chemotaxis protein
MTTDDPLAELREALTGGVAAAADLLLALDGVPAAMEAALNRFGRPTASAEAMRRDAERHIAHLHDLQEVWTAGLASLPEPDVAADRIEEWFERQLEGRGQGVMNATRGRILLIEDDAEVLATVQEMLRELGHDVLIGRDAAQGLTAARAARPDVVVLDLNLPGQSGFDFLPVLRERFPRLPVIAVTALNQPETERLVRDQGAFDYIPKPINLHVLGELVAAALRRGEAP